jgi:hypothetical protein
MRKRSLSTFLAALLFASTCVHAHTGHDQDGHDRELANRHSSDVATAWFETLYDIVRREGAPPPRAARIYGIASVALYESVVTGTKGGRSLAGQLNGLMRSPRATGRQHWPTVANSALATTIRALFPALSEASAAAIDALEQDFAEEQAQAISRPAHERSVAFGKEVAGAILAWAATDGFSQLTGCPYVPVQVAGAWQPTPPLFSSPLEPCWGLLRPMILASGDECRASGAPPFSTDVGSRFYAAALEVYRVGLGLTDEQKTIALYWADGAGATGTPPGHWIAIVSQISRNEDLSLPEAAEAYARVGIAVHDAFIVSWRDKYVTNLQRPVTYINRNIDAGWKPFLVTPSFPTYTSGHSTQSAAAAQVLTDMFGEIRFTDTTHTDHGLQPPLAPRTFESFTEAAMEAAISRLLGGIHFPFDNEDGYASGTCVGQMVNHRVRFTAGRDRRSER